MYNDYEKWGKLPEIENGELLWNKYYIQSAFNTYLPEKREKEERSLIKVNDSFKKIIVVRDDIKQYRDDKGILTI